MIELNTPEYEAIVPKSFLDLEETCENDLETVVSNTDDNLQHIPNITSKLFPSISLFGLWKFQLPKQVFTASTTDYSEEIENTDLGDHISV